jgi:hypothetical protein
MGDVFKELKRRKFEAEIRKRIEFNEKELCSPLTFENAISY